jgi:hypothetical protein
MSGSKIYLTDPQTGQVGFSGLMKENGMQPTNNPGPRGASGDGYNIMALGCIDQFKSGYFRFVTRIRRRHLVVDEERGMVSSAACISINSARVLQAKRTDPFTVSCLTIFRYRTSWVLPRIAAPPKPGSAVSCRQGRM